MRGSSRRFALFWSSFWTNWGKNMRKRQPSNIRRCDSEIAVETIRPRVGMMQGGEFGFEDMDGFLWLTVDPRVVIFPVRTLTSVSGAWAVKYG